MAVTQDNSPNICLAYDTYKACLIEANRIITRDPPYTNSTLITYQSRFLKTIDNVNIPHRDTMIALWKLIKARDNLHVMYKMKILQYQMDELESTVQAIRERKQAAEVDVARQKFDYFPFINALFTKSFKRKLIDVEPAKSTKKDKNSKGTSKPIKKSAKRRKSVGTT